jgi:hypothetical protein
MLYTADWAEDKEERRRPSPKSSAAAFGERSQPGCRAAGWVQVRIAAAEGSVESPAAARYRIRPQRSGRIFKRIDKLGDPGLDAVGAGAYNESKSGSGFAG